MARNGLTSEEFYDTAGAAKSLSGMTGDARFKYLEIASVKAAQIYGLDVITEGIQDDTKNTTRFLIVRPSAATGFNKKFRAQQGYKASITCSVSPNDLRNIFNLICSSGYEVYSIHSRPIVGNGTSNRVFNRTFYIDIGTPNHYKRKSLRSDFEPLLKRMQKEVGSGREKRIDMIRSFGVYPSGKIDLARYQ